ncbi:MAG: hypothetical protein K0R54_5806 [Clostridiaceae bacterium]|nr:hypothetical protein [Clostridiaceae bacterium]MDF2951048.1 hypothetical protein [Anaerocolumna sp.]
MPQSNRECKICGEPYYYCQSCQKLESFESWRLYGHDINCYKIFMILRDDFLKNTSREETISLLNNCDLSNLENFNDNIKTQIKDILSTKKTNIINKKNKNKIVNSINT